MSFDDMIDSNRDDNISRLKMKLKVSSSLHQIAFGLTVCLATCKFVCMADDNGRQLVQNHTQINGTKWTPLTDNEKSPQVIADATSNKSSNYAEYLRHLELNRNRDCCARLLRSDRARDILEASASMMEPIGRLSPQMKSRQSANEDDDQEDDPDDHEGGSQSMSQHRAEGIKWPNERQDNQQEENNRSRYRNIIDRDQPEVDPAAAEQEAAEANEAEAADRSALDEQVQQQREIIMAQAQSEAKAIREQQEALLKQQNLQQQMQLRMNTNQSKHQPSHKLAPSDRKRASQSRPAAMMMAADDSGSYHRPSSINQSGQADIQFSDQQDGKMDPILDSSANMKQDWQHQKVALMTAAETGNAKAASAKLITDDILLSSVNENDIIEPTLSSMANQLPATDDDNKQNGAGDLHTAAQHHYGSHYGSVKGHHGDYYQFAESHKKGQFHSGFKRGGSKFQVSGHASQHKSHAEGHVNWHGKKGKGVQYWDYKHKNKKHHGGYYH